MGETGLGNQHFVRYYYLNDKDTESIKSLASLEKDLSIDISLLFNSEDKKLRVNLKNLSDLPSKFQVYNQTFIDSNVHTSSGVNSSNLTNYYDFCLGTSSVTKQKQIDTIKSENEVITDELKTIEDSIKSKFNSESSISELVVVN